MSPLRHVGELLSNVFQLNTDDDPVAVLLPHGHDTSPLEANHWELLLTQSEDVEEELSVEDCWSRLATLPTAGHRVPRALHGVGSDMATQQEALDSGPLRVPLGTPSAAPVQGAPQAEGRRRGRPPKSDGTYSKKYLKLKKQREREKNSVATLNNEVQQKLARMQQLTAENQMLHVRERVLQDSLKYLKSAFAYNGHQVQEPRGNTAGECSGSKGGTAPAGAAEQHGSEEQQHKQEQRDDDLLEEPNKSQLQEVVQPQQPQKQRLQQQRSPQFQQILTNIRLMHARLFAARSQGEKSDDFMPPPNSMMRLFIALSPDESFALMRTNLETGEIMEDVPPGLWERAAEELELRPEQVARISSAISMFRGSMGRLVEERRDLQQELAGWLESSAVAVAGAEPWPSGKDGGVCAQLEAAEYSGSLLRSLRSNLLREDLMWSTMAWVVRAMLDEQQLGGIVLCCWPYWPRLMLICAAKLGVPRDEGV